MSVKYFIFNTNLLGKQTNIGKVTDLTEYSTKELVERMTQGKTSLGKADTEAFLKIFKETVYNICKEGGTVNIDGFMSFLPSMSGTFESESSSFDKSKNRIYIIAKMSSTINDQFQSEADVEKVTASEKRPLLKEVLDLNTDTTNQFITQNNIITVKGQNLKFDPASPEEYLQIINSDSELEAIKINKFQKLTDKEIVFLSPALPFKTVHLELSSFMGTKRLRIGESRTLIVK